MIKIKQNITREQLEELTDYQMEKLFDYWWNDEVKPRNKHTPTEYIEYGIGTKYKLPLMSIEDMIEYLQQLNLPLKFVLNLKPNGKWYVENYYGFSEQEELCDCLWELTKEVLNK